MANVKSVAVAFADRPWCSLGEAMGFLMVDDYKTFITNYPGIKPWKEIGKKRYYLKEQLFNYVRDNGNDPTWDVPAKLPHKQHVKNLFGKS